MIYLKKKKTTLVQYIIRRNFATLVILSLGQMSWKMALSEIRTKTLKQETQYKGHRKFKVTMYHTSANKTQNYIGSIFTLLWVVILVVGHSGSKDRSFRIYIFVKKRVLDSISDTLIYYARNLQMAFYRRQLTTGFINIQDLFCFTIAHSIQGISGFHSRYLLNG